MRRGLLLFALLASGCREGATPYAPPDRFSEETNGQLTFNPDWDHSPVWNVNGDSVYYVADSYPSFPDTRGLLLAVPRKGGVARMILPAIQSGAKTQPWIAAPAFAWSRNRVAVVEVTEILDREFATIDCRAFESIHDTIGSAATLSEAVLRVRSVGSSSPSDEARLTLKFVGRTFDVARQLTIVVAHPFHRLFEAEGVPIFRPSWSPDGNRLAFSDGTRIHIWTIGQPSAVALPGTEEGIMPAWSPDGNWIAFSKPFRGTPERFFCAGWYSPNPGAFELPNIVYDRTVYPRTRQDAALMLIRPDGSGLRSLGEGDGPAWTPDSKTVIAHRDQSLYRIPIETGAAVLISNTVQAYEPAISSDGRSLALARRIELNPGHFYGVKMSRGNYDIWVGAL